MNTYEHDILEGIFDEQNKKLHQLNMATLLIKSMFMLLIAGLNVIQIKNYILFHIAKQSVKDELQQIYNEVQKISYNIEDMRKDLEKIKEQNSRLKVSLIKYLF